MWRDTENYIGTPYLQKKWETLHPEREIKEMKYSSGVSLINDATTAQIKTKKKNINYLHNSSISPLSFFSNPGDEFNFIPVAVTSYTFLMVKDELDSRVA